MSIINLLWFYNPILIKWLHFLLETVCGVFVEDEGTTKHCGPHSTHVHSWVCQFSTADRQKNTAFSFRQFSREAWLSLWCGVGLWSRYDHQEFWWFSWILSIPVEIISSSSRLGDVVGQRDRAAFWTELCSLDTDEILATDICEENRFGLLSWIQMMKEVINHKLNNYEGICLIWLKYIII